MSAQLAPLEIATGQRTIQLPESLCTRAEQKFGRQFSNIAALLSFVLEQLLSERAEQLEESEQKIVEQRLRDLGYI